VICALPWALASCDSAANSSEPSRVLIQSAHRVDKDIRIEEN
jgi:hypothetical protein